MFIAVNVCTKHTTENDCNKEKSEKCYWKGGACTGKILKKIDIFKLFHGKGVISSIVGGFQQRSGGGGG